MGGVDARLPQPTARPRRGRRALARGVAASASTDAKPFIEPWLSHQRRDAYWEQGSACEHYDPIRCPIFAIGGWSDGYRDMVFRVLEHVRAPVRGLIGPWGHLSPESGVPAPAIGFLQEVRPLLRRQPRRRRERVLRRAGADQLHAGAGRAGRAPTRSDRAAGWRTRPGPRRRLKHGRFASAPESLGETARSDRRRGASAASQTTGIAGGVWDGDGGPADFPLDQRLDDGASLCWDSEPLTERVELLGIGEAQLELSTDRPLGARRPSASATSLRMAPRRWSRVACST